MPCPRTEEKLIPPPPGSPTTTERRVCRATDDEGNATTAAVALLIENDSSSGNQTDTTPSTSPRQQSQANNASAGGTLANNTTSLDGNLHHGTSNTDSHDDGTSNNNHDCAVVPPLAPVAVQDSTDAQAVTTQATADESATRFHAITTWFDEESKEAAVAEHEEHLSGFTSTTATDEIAAPLPAVTVAPVIATPVSATAVPTSTNETTTALPVVATLLAEEQEATPGKHPPVDDPSTTLRVEGTIVHDDHSNSATAAAATAAAQPSVEADSEAAHVALNLKCLEQRLPSEFTYKDQGRDPHEVMTPQVVERQGGLKNIEKRAYHQLNLFLDAKIKPPPPGTTSTVARAEKQASLDPAALEILKVAVAGEYQISSDNRDPRKHGKIVSIRKQLDAAIRNTKHYHYDEDVSPAPFPSGPVSVLNVLKRHNRTNSDDSKRHNRTYSDDSTITQQTRNTNSRTKVQVMNATTIQAALTLAHRPDYAAQESFRLGILNFAGATQPGGGFLWGFSSQESALSRSTLLYPCLETYYSGCRGTDEQSIPMNQTYYRVNERESRNGLYTDCALVSPDVPIVRSDGATSMAGGRHTWLAEPVFATIVTLPAPNRKIGGVSKKDMDVTLERRIKRALDLFMLHGCTHLVLGSFGCGVFGNPPETVARLFKSALTEKKRRKAFDHVIFAVLARSEKEAATLQTFETVFNATVL